MSFSSPSFYFSPPFPSLPPCPKNVFLEPATPTVFLMTRENIFVMEGAEKQSLRGVLEILKMHQHIVLIPRDLH